jgi:hypothetical protein
MPVASRVKCRAAGVLHRWVSSRLSPGSPRLCPPAPCCEYVWSQKLAKNVGLLSFVSLVKQLLSNHNRAKYGDAIEASGAVSCSG